VSLPTGPIFVDTSHLIAMLNRRDQHHARAAEWTRAVTAARTRLVTTEAVLWEWLNACASPVFRHRAAEGYARIRRDPRVETIPADDRRTRAAVALYAARIDKSWSLTDCLSFEVMQERQIRAALTSDQHFEQAGFEALLRRDMP
jgi:predicted nucleic acid-binding protein